MQKQSESSEILFVTKSAGSLSKSTILSLFDKATTLEEVKNIVEKSEDRFYVSWASVDGRDNAGESIPINDIIKTQDTLLGRGGSISDDHSNAIIGKTHAYKVLEHPVAKKVGVLHLNQIYSDNPHDDIVWDEIVKNIRKGSSVAGTKLGEEMVIGDDGMLTKKLVGFSPYETASVYNPCNPFALNEAFSLVAKSGDDKKYNTGENMTDKTNIETPAPTEVAKADEVMVEDEQTDNPEFNVEEAIKNIAQSITALDERMNEIEDKVSGAPETDEEKADEEAEVKADEEDKVEKADEEDKEAEPKEDKEEVEKGDVMKKLQDENVALKEQVEKLTPMAVVKTDRPAEKSEKQADGFSDVMKKIQTGNFEFKDIMKELKGEK